MTEVEKARYIIDKIKNDEYFDLIDYYHIESDTPVDFVRKVRGSLNTSEVRVLTSFAGSNLEYPEWKERHYAMFFATKNILSGKEVTREDKERIINDLLDLGISINDRTVRVMMKRYVRLSLEQENSPKKVLKK